MIRQAPTVLVILLGLAGMLSVYLAAWAQVRSRVPGAQEFTLLMVAVSVYSLGYAIEISRIDLPGILEAIKIEYIGIVVIPPLNLLFALRLVRGKPTPWYIAALLLVIPAITLALVWTVESHTLFYINPTVVNDVFFTVIHFTRGPWYYANLVYLQALPAVSFLLLLSHLRGAGPRQRLQVLGLALGAIFPIISGVFYFTGLIPGGVDPAPFTLCLTGLIFAVTLFKLGLFELVPAARELALDSLNDSFLVFDKNMRLQDLNQAAKMLPGAQDFRIGAALPPTSPLSGYLQLLLSGSKEQVEFSAAWPDTGLPDTGVPNAGLQSYQAKGYPIQARPAHSLAWWIGHNNPFSRQAKEVVLAAQSQSGGVAILIRNITETASLLRQLNVQANTDALTGLLNRRQLIQLAAVAVDNAKRSRLPMGVIMLDLDHFKLINDQYGHAAGDTVLKSVAQCLRSGLRTIDILGRYGGEEFVIFLPETDLDTTRQIAERICTQLAGWTTSVNGVNLRVTASFGVHAILAQPGRTLDDMLKAADLALYQAKTNGRNQISVYS